MMRPPAKKGRAAGGTRPSAMADTTLIIQVGGLYPITHHTVDSNKGIVLHPPPSGTMGRAPRGLGEHIDEHIRVKDDGGGGRCRRCVHGTGGYTIRVEGTEAGVGGKRGWSNGDLL